MCERDQRHSHCLNCTPGLRAHIPTPPAHSCITQIPHVVLIYLIAFLKASRKASEKGKEKTLLTQFMACNCFSKSHSIHLDSVINSPNSSLFVFFIVGGGVHTFRGSAENKALTHLQNNVMVIFWHFSVGKYSVQWTENLAARESHFLFQKTEVSL